MTSDISHLIPSYLINSSTYFVNIIDLEGRYLYANDLFIKTYSFLNNKLIGEYFASTVHPDEVEKCKDAALQCITHPEKIVKINIKKPITSENKFFNSIWEFSLLKDGKGSPLGILCVGYDNTPTEKAIQNAFEFEQTTNLIIDHISDGFMVIDTAWRFVIINKMMEKMLGIEKSECIGKSIWLFFTEHKFEKAIIAYQEVMKSKNTLVFEDFIADKYFESTVYGSPKGITVFMRDITEKKDAARKLTESENKLRAILDSTEDYNVLIGKDYKVLSCNKKAIDETLRIWKKQIEIGCNFLDFIVDEYKNLTMLTIQKAMKGEMIRREVEVSFPNDEKIWFEVTYYPVYDNEGRLIGVSFNSNNINKRKKAEERLKDSESKLRAMFNSRNESKIFINSDLNIVHFNKLAEKTALLFQNIPLAVGNNFLIYLSEESREEIKNNIDKAFSGNSTVEERLVKTLDGVSVWIENSYFPVYDEESKILGVSIYTLNISSRKQAELNLKEKNERLREIAHIQSHTVRRPVATILGLIDLIKDFQVEGELDYLLNLLKKTTEELDDIIHLIVHKADEIES